MNTYTAARLLSLVSACIVLLPFFTHAQSVSVQALSPGNSAPAKTRVTFTIAQTGFSYPAYILTDTFSGSTLSTTNIDQAGNVFWTPVASDVGLHTITIAAHDNEGKAAQTTLSITILPPPSVTIVSASASQIMPGQKFSFAVSSSGFSNPTYIVGDSFSGSSAGYSSIDASGNFSWTPDIAQNGKHTITVYASDTQGHSAQASVDVQVGAGPTLLIQSLLPGPTVSPGQNVTFSASPLNFSPTSFTISDTFAGQTTVSNANITTSGAFTWTPQSSDVGVHVLVVKGQVGAYGDIGYASTSITVLGPGGTLPPTQPSAAATAQNTTSTPSITDLQAKLAALNAQIAAQANASAASPNNSGSANGPLFSSYLRPGSRGDEVMRLQAYLISEGFLTGEATGYYGSLTVDAVAEFQGKHGLAQLGVVGPATRALLNSLVGVSSASVSAGAAQTSGGYVFENFIGVGNRGTDVLELQKKLKALGFFSDDPSGYFGSITQEAVKKFQLARGISAVGYVGPSTRAALNQ